MFKKNKDKLFKILPIIFLFGMIFFGKETKAAVYFKNLDTPTTTYNNANTSDALQFKLGQPITATSAQSSYYFNLGFIEGLNCSIVTPNNGMSIAMAEFSANDYTQAHLINAYVMFSAANHNNGSALPKSFTWQQNTDSSFALNNSHWYALRIYCGDNGLGAIGSTTLSATTGSDHSWVYGREWDNPPYFCLADVSSTDCQQTIPTPNINYYFPTNGTTTPFFSGFILGITNTTSTDTCTITIHTFVPQTSVSQTQTKTNLCGIMQENGIVIPFNGRGMEISTTATTTLLSQATLNINGVDTASTTIAFDLQPICANALLNTCSGQATSTYILTLPTYNNTFTPSGTYAGQVTTTVQSNLPYDYIAPLLGVTSTPSSTISNPYFCNGITDLGNCALYVIYAGGQLLFLPSQQNINTLQATMEGYQNVLPFSLFFAIVNGLNNSIAANNTPTSQTIDMKVMDMQGNYRNLGSINSTFLVDHLTTTSGVGQCNTACAQDKVDRLFKFVKMGIWMTAGIKIVGMITAL